MIPKGKKLNQMEERILACLNRWPGARKREIAKEIHCFVNGTFLRAFSEMENAGLIQHVTINDPANMEFYDKWYLTEAGYYAIMNVD